MSEQSLHVSEVGTSLAQAGSKGVPKVGYGRWASGFTPAFSQAERQVFRADDW